MPPVGGLLAVAVIVSIITTARQKIAPVTIALWLFSCVIMIAAINPLHLDPVTANAASVIGAGLVGLGLPAIHTSTRDEPLVSNDGKATGYARFIGVTIVAVSLVLIGFRTFVTRISSTTGHAFNELTLVQIREAQSGAARGGGLLALFAAVGPLLACLGVYGAYRFSRWWFALTILATVISLQSPSRLNSIGSMVTVVAFWLYLKHANRPPSVGPRRRIRPFVLPIAGIIGALVIFNVVGTSLGKNEVAQTAVQSYSWPPWTLSPVLYFSGGLSALSTALTSSIDPYDQGSSYYAVLRLAEALGSDTDAPDTIGAYVGIPMPFNLYTGFGQVYFDLGLTGVIAFSGVLSWFALTAHRRALLGSMPAAWAAALASNALVCLPLGFIALNLDVLFRLVVGMCAFWYLQATSPTTQQPSDGTIVPRRPMQQSKSGAHSGALPRPSRPHPRRPPSTDQAG